MAKRGGYRPGAGRPKGAKTKNPLGNADGRLPAEVLAQLPPTIEVALDRREWKRLNAQKVATEADAVLSELEEKARGQGDLRLAYQIWVTRIQYAQGTPFQAERENVHFSDLVREAAAKVRQDRAADELPALPTVPAEAAHVPVADRPSIVNQTQAPAPPRVSPLPPPRERGNAGQRIFELDEAEARGARITGSYFDHDSVRK